MTLHIRTLLSATLIVSATLAVTSCGGEDDPTIPASDTVEMQGSPFTVITTPEGSRVADSGDASCTLAIDRTAHTITVEATGCGALGAHTLTFSSLPYRITDGVGAFAVDSVTATPAGGRQPMTVNLLYSGRKSIDDTECTGIGITVGDDTSTLTILPRTLRCEATTTTILTTKPDSAYVSDQTTYTIAINPATAKAEMTVHRARFAANMPALGDMTFPGLDVAFIPGGFILTAASLEPLIADVPYPRYLITDLRAVFCLTRPEATIDFNCMRVFHVAATATSNFAE